VHPLRDHDSRERVRARADLARGARRRRGEQSAVSARTIRRRIASGVMTGVVAVLSFTAVLALILILVDLIAKGASSIDWAFFTKSPVAPGETGGGVANAIVGTGIVVGMAALIGLPIGIGVGLFLAEYGSGRVGFLVRFIADV